MKELPTSGRWTNLRPIIPADYGYLFSLFTEPRTLFRWNLRGRIPSVEEFPSLLWENVLTQSIIERSVDHRPVGLAGSCRVPNEGRRGPSDI